MKKVMKKCSVEQTKDEEKLPVTVTATVTEMRGFDFLFCAIAPPPLKETPQLDYTAETLYIF